MRSQPATRRSLHLLAVSVAPLFAAGCEKPPLGAPAPGSPAALAPSPQAGGGSSTQPAAVARDPAGAARDAALVRDFRLGVEELRKEMAEKRMVERRRERPAAAEKAADALLQSRVTTRLWDDPSVPAGSIAVSVKEGHATLEGRVGIVEQVQRALVAALAVTEVAGVTSKLSIEPDDGRGPTHATPR